MRRLAYGGLSYPATATLTHCEGQAHLCRARAQQSMILLEYQQLTGRLARVVRVYEGSTSPRLGCDATLFGNLVSFTATFVAKFHYEYDKHDKGYDNVTEYCKVMIWLNNKN